MEAVSFYGPPGTGKTETLVRVSRSLLEAQHKVCFVSYTKAAADECSNRIGNNKAGRTLHSLAYRLANISRAAVVSTGKLQTFGEYMGIPCGTEAEDGEGDAYLACIHLARAQLRRVDEVYDRFGRPGTYERFKAFSASYISWKEAYGLVDFSDMIERAMKTNWHLWFDTLIVDEAQDLSPVQWKFIDKMSPQLTKIIIAGDDDQAIFEWSGADPHGMASFDDRFNATRNVLSQSHRVPKAQFRLADSVIKRVSKRVPKEYRPTPEAGKVQRGGGIWDLAFREGEYVLCRDKFKMFEMEQAAIQQGINYRMDGARGLRQRPFGVAMGIWNKLFVEEKDISKAELDKMMTALDDKGKRLLMERNFAALKKRGWAVSIPMPTKALEYFAHTRVSDDKPPVVFSTIHGAKGKEADNVTIYTSASQRVLDAYEHNPDAEHRLYYVGVTRSRKQLSIVDGVKSYEV